MATLCLDLRVHLTEVEDEETKAECLISRFTLALVLCHNQLAAGERVSLTATRDPIGRARSVRRKANMLGFQIPGVKKTTAFLAD